MRGIVKGYMDNKKNSSNSGIVASIRGSIVDVRFEKYLPLVYSLLRTEKDGRIAIEILTQLDESTRKTVRHGRRIREIRRSNERNY